MAFRVSLSLAAEPPDRGFPGIVSAGSALVQLAVSGTSGDDVLPGTPGEDGMEGLDGNDVLFGGDDLVGYAGYADLTFNDSAPAEVTATLEPGDDQLSGGVGNDVIHGDVIGLYVSDPGNSEITADFGDDDLEIRGELRQRGNFAGGIRRRHGPPERDRKHRRRLFRVHLNRPASTGGGTLSPSPAFCIHGREVRIVGRVP